MILLASDTETKPTPAMRQAMAIAEVGDEQKNEDPTVNKLTERVADLLGKEAALLLPTGTMCNLIAIKVHTRPGDVVFADRMAHIIRAESGGAASCSGVSIEPIFSDRGIFTPEALDEAINRVTTVPSPYSPPPRLLCVEQTNNFGGGAVWTLEQLRATCDRARVHGLGIHMDGARLMNGVIASKTPAKDFAASVDSVWIDFTKGLGAPMGAVLAGTQEFIKAARRYKQMFGGALRQAGIIAAGCIYALDRHIDRLQVDHDNAQLLAQGLSEIEGIKLRTKLPESNMVFFDVSGLGLDRDQFLTLLQERGVNMGAIGDYIRAVTHLDVSRQDIQTAISAISDIARNQLTA